MTAVDDPPGPFSHRSAARSGEVRLPASIAVVAAAVSHALLPGTLLAGPRWVIPAIDLALLVPLLAVNPTRLTRETSRSRVIGLVLVTVIIATNLVSLVALVHQLLSRGAISGHTLLYAALQVWLTNIVAFALVYWELDRGGAVARLPSSNVPQRRPDFLFPQDTAAGPSDAVEWIPTFVDYLFISITNSTAFSPTDTLPLTTRAKLLMSVQALAAMITSVLVIARAVNVLS